MTTSKRILTSVLQQLSDIEHNGNTILNQSTSTSIASSTTILSHLLGPSAQRAKSALLTLHFLFPHELLPALDLIDRKLIKKFSCTMTPINQPQSGQAGQSRSTSVFYIQSASAVLDPSNRRAAARGSRFRNVWHATKAHYEVRLDSWNCTCAAFAQAQLKSLLTGVRISEASSDQTAPMKEAWPKSTPLFGGLATVGEPPVPVCKHILAAAVAESAPQLFGQGVQVREVSKAELAAWSAGWGES